MARPPRIPRPGEADGGKNWPHHGVKDHVWQWKALYVGVKKELHQEQLIKGAHTDKVAGE